MFLKPDVRAEKIIRAAVRFETEFNNLLSDGIDHCYALKIESANLARLRLVYIAGLLEEHLFAITECESKCRHLNERITEVTLARLKMKAESEKHFQILDRMSVFFPEYIEVVRAEVKHELYTEKWCRQQESNLRPLHYQ